MAEIKEWTLMFYFASDNPLAPNIVSQLKAIKEAGFHPEANVIAQFDPYIKNTPLHIFDVNRINKLKSGGRANLGFNSSDPYVKNLTLDKLWGDAKIPILDDKTDDSDDKTPLFREELISDLIKREYLEKSRGRHRPGEGTPDLTFEMPKPPSAMNDERSPRESLSNFLDFCRVFYPARHYMLFILGHGMVVGNDLFLFDQHAPEHSLSLTELGEVLGKFKNDIEADDQRGQLELISFHSCSMSALEVAYELQGTAKYMLASQGPAYVGSWPYRHILTRIFNDLTASGLTVREQDGASLVAKLKDDQNPLSTYLCSRFSDSTKVLLNEDNGGKLLDKLRRALEEEFNIALTDPKLDHEKRFAQVQLSDKTKELATERRRETCRMLLNCMLLKEAYPELRTRDAHVGAEKHDDKIKETLKNIFYYCLYNSYDFQLAGYSYDICLCDLTNVRDIKEPFNRLTEKLIQSLAPTTKDPLIQELILLAHWDAQSYWQETYTDLYDFCLCLERRCSAAQPALATTRAALDAIQAECNNVMDIIGGKLEKDVKDEKGLPVVNRENMLVVRSGFTGPAYQYSHGLSIFFPWSQPIASRLWDEQYEKFKMIEKTKWKEFLQVYFNETMREARKNENDPRRVPERQPLEERLLEGMAGHIINAEGALQGGKDGEKDGPKAGPNDPTGGGCECPSIKNYPSVTRERRKDKVKGGKMLLSPNFSARFSSGE